MAHEPFVYGKFRFHDEHGLTIDGSPTITEGVECLLELVRRQKRRQLWIGDVVMYSDRSWGQMYTEAIRNTGLDYNTLANYKWVAGRVDPSRRCPSLGFAHHREVAKLSPGDQERLLARAEAEGWSSTTLSYEVQRLVHEAKRPAGSPLLSGLHYGDPLETMATLPNESIDLLLTHPPAPAVRCFEDVLRCAITKLKPNSHVYVFTTWETYDDLFRLIGSCLNLSNMLLWVLTNREQAVEAPTDHQILFAHKGHRILNGKRESDVVYFEPALGHPFDKPVPLLRYLIEKSTQPKEIVLDPYMGGGSTCVAARNAGRGYIGIEAESRWYGEAQRRLAPLAVA